MRGFVALYKSIERLGFELPSVTSPTISKRLRTFKRLGFQLISRKKRRHSASKHLQVSLLPSQKHQIPRQKALFSSSSPPKGSEISTLSTLLQLPVSLSAIPSPSTAQRMANAGDNFSQIDISKEEKDKLVSEVIRYVLFKTHQSSGCPIKRDELTLLVTKNYRQRALPSLVINEAREKLSSIFGYEMRELQRTRPFSTNQLRSSQQSLADTKSYVIISQLPADVYKRYIEDKQTSHMTGFTFVVIGIVHLAGGKIPEENLWNHLRRLGLYEADEKHAVLGNIKLALEALVQQRYLQKNKVNGPEGTTLFYELAERALDESSNKKIQEYISQIVNKEVTSVEADD